MITNLATAAEYPRGTVSSVASAEPDVVGPHVQELLAHPEERRALADAGMRFASEHQFRDLAGTLVSLVTA